MLTNHCYQGDCRAVMRELIAAGVRVQCIVTSPPYWGLRDYGHPGQLGQEPTLREFLANMVEVFDLCRELLADDGTLWLNMGDGYVPCRAAGVKPKDVTGQPWRLAFALQDAGWWLRQDIVWHKPNPMPESIRDRCTKSHEYVFLLTKSERYFYDFSAMQEPVSGGAHARLPGNGVGFGHGYDDAERVAKRGRIKMPDGWDTGAGGHGSFHRQGREKGKTRKLADGTDRTKNNESFDAAMQVMPATRNRRSVWTIPTQAYPEAHFATFPEALVEPCILAGSRPGDIVLDPFMGSGTVASVAQRLGRRWLGTELNPEYIALQAERTRQPGLVLEVEPC